MSDQVEVVVQDDQQLQEPAYAGDDYQVFVDDAPAVAPETQRLMDELKQKQAELQLATARNDPVLAMQQGIADLGKQLNPQKPADVRVEGPQGIDMKKLEDEFNKGIYDNPFQKVVELIGLSQQMSSSQQANTNLLYSKRLLQVDPNTKDLYKRYEGEVDAEVAKMPAAERASNPNVYEDALVRIKARHMEELFEERLQLEMQKRLPTQPQQTQRSIGNYAEGPGVRPAGALQPQTAQVDGVRVIKMSQQTKMEIENFANDKMIPFSAALSIYERRGLIK